MLLLLLNLERNILIECSGLREVVGSLPAFSTNTDTQCTIIPSQHVEAESISIAGMTSRSQDLTLVEAEVNLTRNEWKKHPLVTGPEAPCILSIDFL